MRSVVIACLFLISSTAVAETQQPFSIDAGVDLSFIGVSGHPSWTEGFVGKLRYSENDSRLKISRAYLDVNARLADTLSATVVMEAYTDDLGFAADFTEAYLSWRPVPSSANRYRLKVGAFYPRISLENTSPGWSSPYTLNSSAINTWVAEELRSFGAELSWSRRLQNRHTISAQGSVFYNNDPAGSLLAWKGWSIHDRQTRFNDKLPLPPLPQIQPGGMFAAQDPYVAPFREIDSKAGYYVNVEYLVDGAFQARAMHYDNRADPTLIEDGQYGWTTRFNHVGFQATLPADFGLIGQWMDGTTVMGPATDGIHPVDVEYTSYFGLLTRGFGNHRVSARYDNFAVSQNDSTPEDNNPENGLAWTLGYRYSASESVEYAVEWLSITTHRCANVYYGLEEKVTEQQFQLTARFMFGSH
jgi:hypothetical protein